jgi:hypothetical protein
MAEKYPRANVRYVEGASGDEGLDIFRGDLTCGPTIWQCKGFQVTTIGNSQKDQIRKSLRDAVGNFSPRLWVLCLNMSLDTKAHRWFQKLQTTYAAKGVRIELVQGSDIIHELMFRHTLRDHYFPNASILDELRRLVPRSTVLSEVELEPIPGEAVEEYVARLRDKDPRFIYEITIGRDRGPAAFPPSPEPGMVAAFTDGGKTVKAYARDAEALLLDPVRFSVTFAGTGVEKMVAAIRTGRPQHFEPEEIHGLTGNVPLLSSLKLAPGEFGLDLCSAPKSRRIPLRVSFVGKDEQVVYELLEFVTTRAGTDEVEISTEDKDLPFQIGFVFRAPIDRGAKVGANIKKQFAGRDAIQARKALIAFRILRLGCSIELFSLQQEKKVAVLGVPPVEFEIPIGMSAWISRLARVSEHFGVPIRLPDRRDVSEADLNSLAFLYAVASGEGLSVDNVAIKLVKSEQNSKLFPAVVREPTPLTMVHDDVTFHLFGNEFRVGRCAIHLGKIEFDNPEGVLLDFQKAKIGEGVPLSIHPIEPARVSLVAQGEEGRSNAGRQLEEGAA